MYNCGMVIQYIESTITNTYFCYYIGVTNGNKEGGREMGNTLSLLLIACVIFSGLNKSKFGVY